MTREEAIEVISQDIPCEHDADLIEALKMALKLFDNENVLDKIRDEIEWLRLHRAEFLTSDNKVCIDSQKVLEIIDKYKAESEMQDAT